VDRGVPDSVDAERDKVVQSGGAPV
jgi:hypothetical protein